MAFIKYGEDRREEKQLNERCPFCNKLSVYLISGERVCRNCGAFIDQNKNTAK